MNNLGKKLLADYLILPLWRIMDFFIPKKKDYWAFAVHHIKSDQFIENARAIFEEVKTDDSVKKIIFTRGGTQQFFIERAVNYKIVETFSWEGLYLLTKCKVMFLTHSIAMDYSLRFGDTLFSVVKPKLRSRVIVNLWHGIALKKLLALTNTAVKEQTDRVSFRRKERLFYTGFVTSSSIDSYAMATMFYPIKYENIWVTGLPRNDFLVKKPEDLPSYLRDAFDKINTLKKDKTLIVYAPTYRQTTAVADASYYQFSDNEMALFKKLLVENNAILGFRMHYFRNSTKGFNFEKYIDNEVFFDLGHKEIAEIAPVIRASDVVITDYSSVYIDAMYINKPVFSFAYDLEHYTESQDGILYDMDIAFPSTVVTDFNDLLKLLESELMNKIQVSNERYNIARKLFFTHTDQQNSKRVVERVFTALSGN